MTDTAEIINAIQVCATFNPSVTRIAQEWLDTAPMAPELAGAARDAQSVGGTIFEYLSREAPRLADAIHDFVYQIACPHLSVIAKNLAREEVCKVVLQIV